MCEIQAETGEDKMSSTIEVLKTILESIPPGIGIPWHPLIEGKDAVLREITAEEKISHEEICNLDSELRAHLWKSLRLIRLFEAKKTLLLERLYSSDERAETADIRNRAIGFRRTNDGKYVLVESSIE